MPSKQIIPAFVLALATVFSAAAHAQSTMPGAPSGPGAGSPTTPRTDDTLIQEPMGNDTEHGTVMEHENRITLDGKTGSGTDGTDARTTGSGTTSESIPRNIPPARSE